VRVIEVVEDDAAEGGEGGVAFSGDGRVEGRVCAPESEPQFCRPMVVVGDAYIQK
jgi:hypothetical protein